VLGPEVTSGPAAARLEFDSQEISDLAIDAITDLSHQFALRIADAYVSLERDGLIELKTRSGKRDVFEISDALAHGAGFVLPVDIHHVRA